MSHQPVQNSRFSAYSGTRRPVPASGCVKLVAFPMTKYRTARLAAIPAKTTRRPERSSSRSRPCARASATKTATTKKRPTPGLIAVAIAAAAAAPTKRARDGFSQ